MSTATVDIVLPRDLADRVFGLYLFGVKERGDLSRFTNFSIFADEITQSLQRLSADDQKAVHRSLEAALTT